MQFDRAVLLDALSQRVLRHLPASAWRKLFLRPLDEVMHLLPQRGTVLCAAAEIPAWSAGGGVQQELEFMARAHGGEIDPCPPAIALVRFQDPQAALAMAIDLQRLCSEVRYQVGLASGDCVQALLQMEASTLPVLVGDAVDRAEQAMRQATPGSIRLTPEVFEQVQDQVQRTPGCMIAAEYEGDELAATSLTLAPRASAFLSTFAGLGLT